MSTRTQPKHYRLTRRGEVVRDTLIVGSTVACLVLTGLFGFGLMVGWFGR